MRETHQLETLDCNVGNSDNARLSDCPQGRRAGAQPAATPARSTGRSSLFQPDYCEQARKLCLLGAIDRDLARILGVSERTINRWKRQHPDFAAALNAGKAAADAEVAEALHKKAVKGDMSAISFWLRNRRPDLWRDRREAGAGTGRPDGSRPASPPVREIAKAVALILQRGLHAAERS